ncbi:MAG: hypothetical protein AB8B69_10070 [Chitinophagales bacterium]
MTNEQKYWEEFDECAAKGIRPIVEKIIKWVRPKVDSCDVSDGSSKYWRSIVPVIGKSKLKAFSIWASDRFAEIEVNFGRYTKKYSPMDKDEKKKELVDKLNEIEGVNISYEEINKRPRFKIQLLENESNFKKFTEAFDWFYEQLETKT